ncbi:2-C-methyl-D-erythritol 2,4-cyclodiphosphate synthase [Pseudohongiella spirulinae]|uniref:2-C-methyl-D-erythritol 2,4-cyclodiphosphate synthase n=1 Tax=Pseudohongiella spirulinae TaxID=1249552 RepID=UPI000717A5C3|nr:2-C-methyl-D-erythritol 2,4-cyclodiphosphate synthase [Pseudohongiella spirulinae]
MRIGHGYDAHRFAEPEDQRPLMLGGVHIPHDRGLLAHSDGDALIHALCDALLGALGRGDIGRHFPDNDASYKDVDSCVLLTQVMSMVHKEGWRLVNTDLTILAQEPRMSPHIEAMREQMAGLLSVSAECVNVKASTTEGMGFVGRREGIETHAVVLLGR